MTGNRQFRVPHVLVSGALTLLLAACSAGDAASGAERSRRSANRESSAGAIESPAEPYREVAVTNSGNLTGKVVVEGDLPDAGFVAADAATPCGAGLADSSVVNSANTLAGVVVWITNVRQGRALPLARRLQIVHEGCTLGPRVQGAVVGSTINVMNQDAMVTRFRAVRDGSSDTIAVFRFSDPGQVVPSEEIADAPGLIALRSEDRRTLGWVAVFDHPYFAVTGPDGTFRIDSLPPGKYHLRAWHERAPRPIEGNADVHSGKDTEVELKLQLK